MTARSISRGPRRSQKKKRSLLWRQTPVRLGPSRLQGKRKTRNQPQKLQKKKRGLKQARRRRNNQAQSRPKSAEVKKGIDRAAGDAKQIRVRRQDNIGQGTPRSTTR